jgi:hypothetical protein
MPQAFRGDFHLTCQRSIDPEREEECNHSSFSMSCSSDGPWAATSFTNATIIVAVNRNPTNLFITAPSISGYQTFRMLSFATLHFESPRVESARNSAKHRVAKT